MGVIIITRTSHYESFTVSGTGYNANRGHDEDAPLGGPARGSRNSVCACSVCVCLMDGARLASRPRPSQYDALCGDGDVCGTRGTRTACQARRASVGTPADFVRL